MLCQDLVKSDFFLQIYADKFMHEARVMICEMHCTINRRVDLVMLAQKLQVKGSRLTRSAVIVIVFAYPILFQPVSYCFFLYRLAIWQYYSFPRFNPLHLLFLTPSCSRLFCSDYLIGCLIVVCLIDIAVDGGRSRAMDGRHGAILLHPHHRRRKDWFQCEASHHGHPFPTGSTTSCTCLCFIDIILLLCSFIVKVFPTLQSYS